MSKEGLKRRIDENKKKLNLYWLVACGSVGFYVVVRLLLRWRSAGTWQWIGAGVGAAMLYMAFRCLKAAAEPTYSAEWEIVDAGEDLAKASPQTSNFKDLLWASAIMLCLASFTSYAWLLAVAIPAYGLWATFGKLLGPMLGGQQDGGQGEETEADRKRREKTEKRAEKRRVKRF